MSFPTYNTLLHRAYPESKEPSDEMKRNFERYEIVGQQYSKKKDKRKKDERNMLIELFNAALGYGDNNESPVRVWTLDHTGMEMTKAIIKYFKKDLITLMSQIHVPS